MNEDKFWMVFIDGKSSPTKLHFTVDEARLEAERLVQLPGNEGRKAYILESMSFGMVERPPVVWRTLG